MTDEPRIEVRLLYGHVRGYSWLEWRPDGRLVGMGRIVKYDERGNVTEDRTEPNGVELRWER